MRARGALAAIASLLVAAGASGLLADAASACAVCMASNGEESRKAFIWTTVFMSVLPLAAIGAGALWLRRAMLRAGEAERLAHARREAAAVPAPARGLALGVAPGPSGRTGP